MRYLVTLFLIALLAACGTPSAAQPTRAPIAAPVATIAPAAPTTAVLVTSTDVPTAELATDEPTDEPTDTPVATVPKLAGAAPTGNDCPVDHAVKGNIVDRGANKGEKIYHLPSSSSYKATKPERCFVDAAEAEAAGFRAPK